MAKMLQIRHVPDAVHRKLRARAALAGMTLSDYLRKELEAAAERLTPAELRERLSHLPPASLHESPVDALAAEREGR